MARPGKSVEEGEDGRAELVSGALPGGADNLLTRVFPEVLSQVKVGRVRGQKHLTGGLVGQPDPWLLIFAVRSLIAHDVDAGSVRMGSQQLLVQAPPARGR